MEKSSPPEVNISDTPKSSETDGRQRLKSNSWWRPSRKDTSHVSVDVDNKLESETSSIDHSSGSILVKNVDNVFEAPEAVDLYKLVEGFEGTHRFDPTATWTQAEEKALVRKVRSATIANAYMSNNHTSSTGVSLFQHVSCSSHFNSIAAISLKLFPIICFVSRRTVETCCERLY